MADPSSTLIDHTTIEDSGSTRIVRGWHPNGLLVKEKRGKFLSDGRFVLHGTSSRWNSAGELIGPFDFIDGNGVASEWYDNGQLMHQVPMRDGYMTGLMRAWDEGGCLLVEKFYYRGRPVSKKRYRELQHEDKTIPQYDEADFRTIAQKRRDSD
jgi:antitoxin component YwqK of YwqJK toxin-antitoxin module